MISLFRYLTQGINQREFLAEEIPDDVPNNEEEEASSKEHLDESAESNSVKSLHDNELELVPDTGFRVSTDVNEMEQVKNAIEAFKCERAIRLKTFPRCILGLVTQQQEKTIQVDNETDSFSIDLDKIECTFSPRINDYVLMECNVELRDNNGNDQHEELQVVKVTPSNIQPKLRRKVTRVYQDWVALSDSSYVLREDIPLTLHLDDNVLVDLIECKYLNFTNRAINLQILEKTFATSKKERTQNGNCLHGDLPIVFEGDRAFFTQIWQKFTVEVKVTNNLNRKAELLSVKVLEQSDSQFTLIYPKNPVDIEANKSIALIFEVNTQTYGEFRERFQATFDKFKVTRSFTIVVARTAEEASDAKSLLVAADYHFVPGKSANQRNRLYANKVWANEFNVIPGEYLRPRIRFVSVRLEQFEVPRKLSQMYFTLEPRNHMRATVEREYPQLHEPLTIDNYKEKFSLFLYFDEITTFYSFRNFDIERGRFQRDGDFLSLRVEKLGERRPSLVVGDSVHAVAIRKIDKLSEMKFEGVIHKVMFDRVLLKFHSNFQANYANEEYRLEFFFSRYALRKQHFAIGQIIDKMGESFLFPRKLKKRKYPQLDIKMNENNEMILFDTKINWYNPLLNEIQKRAVFNILRGESDNMPYVIFGPPGTGKTVTMIETILQILNCLPQARLLVATPSNMAADLILQRILDSNAVPENQILRMVSQNQIEKDLIPKKLISYCGTLDLSSAGTCEDPMLVTASGMKLRCKKDFIGRQRVTVSTCTTMGSLLQLQFPKGHFSHVLIDEAGQCTEPETITPIALVSRKRSQVILSGDPYQLQPVIVNSFASINGYGKSFLERVLEFEPYTKDLNQFPTTSGYNPCVVTKLLHGYRSLPSIMSFYSKIFYDNELISEVSATDSPQEKVLAKVQGIFHSDSPMPHSHGVVFIGVMGENMQDEDSPSWYNMIEASEVFMMTLELYRRSIKSDQIGIITPYIKQVLTIRSLFLDNGIDMPKVGSVEEFQGQENDIILVSTVRSATSMLKFDARLGLGFVRCNKRMNVAISRARSLLVVFGNPFLLSVDDNWRQLLQYCSQNNSYLGCAVPDSVFNPKESSPNEEDARTSASNDSFESLDFVG
ncbi:probable RNA helicase armi [Drosophila tropicalis]|uniref:probable RNA helicase armi n=1 Tax=Drosophila tropicalis TaxID=46794 RepID=UPI0035AB877A